MKKLFNILIFCVVAMTMTQCFDFFSPYEWHPIMTFRNNSQEELVAIYDFEYPDTLLKNFWYSFYCPPQKDTTLWHEYEKDVFIEKYPIFQLFIFRDSDVTNYLSAPVPIENGAITEIKPVLKRYVLTREWLEQHDWTVTYP